MQRTGGKGELGSTSGCVLHPHFSARLPSSPTAPLASKMSVLPGQGIRKAADNKKFYRTVRRDLKDHLIYPVILQMGKLKPREMK